MSEEILSGRVETFNFGIQAVDGKTLTSPVYRLVIDVSFGSLLGAFQSGYYVHVGDGIYFVSKQTIQVATAEQATKVFAFLQKTKQLFTISVKHSETLSGHQYVTLNDVTDETEFYTLKEFRLFHGLWRTIEGELFENLYSPSIARFTSEKLDWYVKLIPEYPLKFKQVSSISVTYVTSQGHLEVFKISSTEPLPGYLYSARKKLTFFNHEINQTVDVIPLGGERRIIAIPKETKITSEDHEAVTLPQGQYLLFHPRPRRDGVD